MNILKIEELTKHRELDNLFRVRESLVACGWEDADIEKTMFALFPIIHKYSKAD